jgi:putative membrane protein insertion efficiency factor
VSFLLMGAIRLYQLRLSPMLGPACRYEPTCSAYAHEAIERHGSMRGGWMAVRRLGRCRPGSTGGYDPVAERTNHDADGGAPSRDQSNDGEALDPPAVVR